MKPSTFAASSEDAAGVSISFDPQALQEEEEAELAREEQQRQHELQALLRQALDGGLTDEDEDDEDDEEGEVSQATFDPDISSEISSVSDQPPHVLWPNQGGTAFEDFGSGNPEGVRGRAAQAPYMSERYAQENQRIRRFPGGHDAKVTNEQSNFYINGPGDPVSGIHAANPGSSLGPRTSQMPYEETSVQGIKPSNDTRHYPINSDPVAHQYQNNSRTPADYGGYPIVSAPSSGSNQHHISEDNVDEYRVRYRGPLSKTSPPSATINETNDVAPQHTSELRTLQEDFISAGGMTENSRLGQLQILYNARGRKIEELDNQLKQLQDDSGREIRILKHKMALMQDEKAGVEGSLEQCQNMLSDNQEQENKVQGQVKALEATVQALQDAKTELVKKLQNAESSVESLNSQLIELGSSDSLARARQHHESAVGALQKKYDAEIIALKQKLDQQSQETYEKGSEVSHLRKQFEQLSKSAEEAKLNKAETINRLTRSLEESQRQCQQLLECNSGQENSRLKIQLQEAVAAKSISEDLNNALQDEIKDLKEQLTIYESASTFGILPSGMTSTPAGPQQYSAEDSFTQLGLRKARTPVDFNTPDSVGEVGKLSKEENTATLKNELERCVNMYRNKRHQVSLLQEELRVVRNTNQQTISELQDLKEQYTKAKEQLKDYEEIKKSMETSEGSYKEAKLQRQVDNLFSEREDLLGRIQDLETRIEEIAESESQTKEFNRELSAQMAEMVHQFDEDKRQALLTCEETVRQHYESMKDVWREEHRKEFEEEKARVEELCSQLKFELEETRNELDEVKEFYVKACNEKDELEEQLNKEWEERLAEDLDKVTAQLEGDKSKAVETMKEKVSNENVLMLESAKEKWLKEQEETFKDSVKTEVVLAKTLWIQEQQEEKEMAIKSAIEETEESWSTKLEEEVRSALNEAQEKWLTEQENILKEKLDEAHAEWRRTELPKFIENNRSSPKSTNTPSASNTEWQKERMKLVQSKDEERKFAVQEARKQLDEDYKTFMAEHRDAMNKALKTARDQSDKEKQDIIAKYENIIKTLREKKDVEELNKQAAEDVELKWNQKLEEVLQQHEQEKEELTSSNRETLYKALEEARYRWQSKFEEAMTEQEMEWNMDRDKMLKEAESHVDSECERLRQQHQQEVQEIRRQHETQLEHALSQLREELGDNDLNIELAQVQHQLQQQEDQFNEELRQLKQDLDEKEEQVQEIQQELHKVQMQVVEQKQDYERHLEKAEVQKQEAISAYSQSEKEHGHMVKSYKTRISEITEKLHRMENKLKAASTGTEMQLQALQESMEREYSVAMEKMKEKMLTMQQQLAKNHEIMKRKKTVHTQTNDSPSSENLEKMRSYYLDIITKMKRDVMQHVAESNEEAANKVRHEVLRERHFTAKRLRRYYMKCLVKMLDSFDGDDKTGMLVYMDQMLHNMPEKESSCSSASSVQGMRPLSVTDRTHTPSGESSRSAKYLGGPEDAKVTDQSHSFKSALQSQGLPAFSKRTESPSSTHRTNFGHPNDQYNRSSRRKTKQTPHTFPGTQNSGSVGSPFAHDNEQTYCKSYLQDDLDDPGTPQLLSTGESIGSSASCAWATPSQLLSKLSPQHRLMLENAAGSSSEAAAGQSPPTTDKSQKSGQKYYKLDLQILDCDRYSMPRSERGNSTPSGAPVKQTRKDASTSNHSNTLKTFQKSKGSMDSESTLCGSPAMFDVRGNIQFNGSAFALMKSNSDDCLNNSNSEGQQRKPMSSTELRNLTFRRRSKNGPLQGVGYLGSPPSKSQSMPNVADAVERQDCEDSVLGVNEKDSSYNEPQLHYQHRNYTQLTEPNKKFKSLPTQTVPSKTSSYSSNKKEGCRVSFKNVDLDSTDTSDNESVQSFVSTSSVTGFREALRSRRNHVRSSAHRPVQVSASVDIEKEDAAKTLLRPIALVTRHTQVPSPLPSKRK